MTTDHSKGHSFPPRGPLPLLPPPQQVHPGDVLAILQEIPSAFGVMVWKAVRTVELWARSGESDRRTLFAKGARDRWFADLSAAAGPAACTEILHAIFLHVGSAKRTAPDNVASLCLRLSDWCEHNRAPATAVALAEAAALAHPCSPRPALVAGRLLKRRGEYARAETWLHYALSLAVAAPSRDHTVAAQAWCELGMIYTLRGNLRSAEASYLRAYRIARRHHMQHQLAVALHDLFLIAVQCDDVVRAQKYGRQAALAYYAGHPRLAAFSNDVAYFWMLQGEFACALQVFTAVLPQLTDYKERVFTAANIIRAAGGAGRTDILEAYWKDTLSDILALDIPAAQPWALLDLAHGAASARQWVRAEEAAVEAIQSAQRQSEHKTLMEAEAVLDSVRRYSLADVNASTESPRLPECESLANALESCLRRAVTLR